MAVLLAAMGGLCDTDSRMTLEWDGGYQQAYTTDKLITKGQRSKIYAVTSKKSGQKFVTKVLDKKKAKKIKQWNHDAVMYAKREIEAFHQITKHDYIVKCLATYEDKRSFYMVLEQLKGPTLADYLVERKKLPENEVALVMWAMMNAVNDLHSAGVIHRDLRVEKFVFADEACDASRLKLVGLGNCNLAVDECRAKPLKFVPIMFPTVQNMAAHNELLKKRTNRSLCCDHRHTAPEALKGNGRRESDYWALGIIMHVLLTGEYPFDGPDAPTVLKQVHKAEVNYKTDAWKAVSDEAKDMVMSFLDPFWELRMTTQEGLTHSFFVRHGLVNAPPSALSAQGGAGIPKPISAVDPEDDDEGLEQGGVSMPEAASELPLHKQTLHHPHAVGA